MIDRQAPNPITPRRPSILIRRYAPSRLFDTDAAEYRTLDELRHWADKGVRFAIVDAETGQDVTHTLIG